MARRRSNPPDAATASPPEGAGRARRKNDPDATRDDIVRVATDEFATNGYSGARVDAIAERTRTSKRMIYYYFGSKEGLYLAVLERAYQDIRAIEEQLPLADLPADQAMRRLVEATFDYDEQHPDFIRLVSIENIHRAENIKASPLIPRLNLSVITVISALLARGRQEGVFRRTVDPVDLHMMMSSMCFFRVSNRHTFGAIFNRDLSEPGLRAHHRRMIADAVLAYLALPDDGA